MKAEHYVFVSNEQDGFNDIYTTKILDNYVKLDLELKDKDGKLIDEGELHVQIVSELYMPLIVKRFNPFEGKLSLVVGNDHIGKCDAVLVIRLKSDKIVDTAKSKVDVEFLNTN
ncbi:MAG: hypothetical protein GKC00_02515 [Candidatus Methanofastidiosa archaeon]|nr:hypothetical protein [Candidatus Methanofastidiosa archaeon]